MVEVTQLTAESRSAGPQSSLRMLRQEGRVPAIVYGANKDPEIISLDAVALKKEINRGGFSNRLFDLKTDKKTERVLPREVQLHPVTDKPIHIDFLRLTGESEVRLAVPVAFVDEEKCPGIKRGGLINVVRHDIELICRADSIPENLSASLDGLEIGDSIHINNINLPDNVRPYITDRDFTVATIAPPTIIREEATSEAEGEEESEVENEESGTTGSENKTQSGE